MFLDDSATLCHTSQPYLMASFLLSSQVKRLGQVFSQTIICPVCSIDLIGADGRSYKPAMISRSS